MAALRIVIFGVLLSIAQAAKSAAKPPAKKGGTVPYRCDRSKAQDANDAENATDWRPMAYASIKLETDIFGTPELPHPMYSLPVCNRTNTLTSDPDRWVYPWDIRYNEVANSYVQVELAFVIERIVEVLDHEQSVCVAGTLQMKWTDCRLGWRREDYENISEVTVPPTAILWTPNIIIEESYDGSIQGPSFITVYHSGNVVKIMPQVNSKVVCRLDMDGFPFDTQHCKFTFLSPQDDVRYQNISHLPDSSYLRSQQSIENSQWDYKKVFLTYDVDDTGIVRVTVHLTIGRLPLYQLFNLVIPCTLLTVLCCAVFAMPTDCNTKISMAMTVLLAIIVFMLILYDRLPESGLCLALLSEYFAACLCMCAMSCLCTIFVSLIDSFQETEAVFPVPQWLHRICLHRLGPKLLSIKRRHLIYQQNSEGSSATRPCDLIVQENGDQLDGNQTSDVKCVEAAISRRSQNCCPFSVANGVSEWKFVAAVFDRIIFILFCIYAVGSFSLFMLHGTLHSSGV